MTRLEQNIFLAQKRAYSDVIGGSFPVPHSSSTIPTLTNTNKEE